MKQCPNPTCRAHQGQWEFEESENYCPVCGERLRSSAAAAVAPTNVMAAQAAAADRPYIDSYMEVRNNSTTPIGLFVAVLAAIILLLLLWLVISWINTSRNGNNAAAISTSASAIATAAAQATQTSIALAAMDVPITSSGTVLPLPYATGPGGSGGSGGFPTATSAPIVESTPIPFALGGAGMVHNIGMVASCTDSTLKPTYHPNEHFFVMVQADFGRTQVSEIHALWQMPPNYSTVIDARGDAMSIDNPAPGLKLRDGGMYYVCFQAIPPQPQNAWPVGYYRVDIYINNGALPVTSKDFAVVQ